MDFTLFAKTAHTSNHSHFPMGFADVTHGTYVSYRSYTGKWMALSSDNSHLYYRQNQQHTEWIHVQGEDEIKYRKNDIREKYKIVRPAGVASDLQQFPVASDTKILRWITAREIVSSRKPQCNGLKFPAPAWISWHALHFCRSRSTTLYQLWISQRQNEPLKGKVTLLIRRHRFIFRRYMTLNER